MIFMTFTSNKVLTESSFKCKYLILWYFIFFFILLYMVKMHYYLETIICMTLKGL